MLIVFLFYEGMTALDAIGPHEILSRLPGAQTQRVAQNRGPIRSDSGLVLLADYSLSDISHADLLLIPGAGNATTLIDMELTLTAKIAGVPFAQAMQLGIEYDPEPPFDVGSPEKANPAIREALRARMIASFEPSTAI